MALVVVGFLTDEDQTMDVDRQKLRILRERRGWDQARLARETGLSRPYINQLESGVRSPSPPALKVISEALDVPLGELLMSEPVICPNCGYTLSI